MAKRAIGTVLGAFAILFTAVPAMADDQLTVEHKAEPASTVSVVAKDALYGGIAGAAIGGGILLIQNDGWDGKTMGIATGVGLLAGAGLGLVDAATQHPAATARNEAHDTARPTERTGARDTGLTTPIAFQHGGSF